MTRAAGDDAAGSSDAVVRATVVVHGFVQGVGFRWYTRAKAKELGLTGRATNLDDGRVEIVAEGRQPAVAALIDWLRTGDTPGRVDDVVVQMDSPRHDHRGFDVR